MQLSQLKKSHKDGASGHDEYVPKQQPLSASMDAPSPPKHASSNTIVEGLRQPHEQQDVELQTCLQEAEENISEDTTMRLEQGGAQKPEQAFMEKNHKITTVDKEMATNEDLPRCDSCGRTFGWNQLHLRWKHKCEPTEVAHTTDQPWQRQQLLSTASDIQRRLNIPMAEREGLHSGTTEHDVQSEIDSAPQVCRCGKTFTGIQFVKHTLTCREGTSLGPPAGARR